MSEEPEGSSADRSEGEHRDDEEGHLDLRDICVSLSGGGHRATLFGLGGLMALVDRGLNQRVSQIASVSGGSILNATVASRVSFNAVRPEEMDRLAAEIFAVVTQRGILTRRTISVLVAVFGGGALAAVLASAVLIPNGLGVIGAALCAVVVFTSGLQLALARLLEFRLRRRFGLRSWPQPAGRQSPVHVFCSTDLVSGRPVYFSTAQEESVAWVPDGPSFHSDVWPSLDWSVDGERVTTHLDLAQVVRASAAFPGLPPVHVRGGAADEGANGQHLVLVDGGVWNNLGSQATEESGYAASFGSLPSDRALVCIDASAPIRPHSDWKLRLPGVGVLASAIRVMSIQNYNTVGPRVDAFRQSAYRTLEADLHTPVVVVARNGEDPGSVFSLITHNHWLRAARRRQQLVDAAVEDRLRTLRTELGLGEWSESPFRAPLATAEDLQSWREELSSAVLETIRELDSVFEAVASNTPVPRRKRLLHTQPEKQPTTLDRVREVEARDLVLRGYAATMQWSFVIRLPRLGEDGRPDLPEPAGVLQRIRDLGTS